VAGGLTGVAVRKVGLALLIIGMIWLISMQLTFNLRGGIRPVLQAQHVQLDANPETVYSRQDVEFYIRNTATAAFDAQPLFVLPAIIIFAGGLLASRRQTPKS
jgi:hypothetical protein